MNPIQIPTNPKPGEIWFYLDLAWIEKSKIPGLFALLDTLDLQPKWAYRQFPGGIEVCLLLYQGFLEGISEPPRQLLQQEQTILANALEDPNAIHFLCGLNRKQPAIAS